MQIRIQQSAVERMLLNQGKTFLLRVRVMHLAGAEALQRVHKVNPCVFSFLRMFANGVASRAKTGK